MWQNAISFSSIRSPHLIGKSVDFVSLFSEMLLEPAFLSDVNRFYYAKK